MNRQEIESKVKEFLLEDLEIDEENIFPEAKLKEERIRTLQLELETGEMDLLK